MVKSWIVKVVMVIVCSVMLVNVANAKSNFNLLNDSDIQKGAWKLEKKQFKKVIQRVKVIDIFDGDILFLKEDGKTEFPFYLYGCYALYEGFDEAASNLPVDYFKRLKMKGSYVDIVVMGSYESGGVEVNVGLMWVNDFLINVDLVKKGYVTYDKKIPKDAVEGWYVVDELDFNYLLNCFSKTSHYAEDNKLGVWKNHKFKRR